jgi:hypothetical protein
MQDSEAAYLLGSHSSDIENFDVELKTGHEPKHTQKLYDLFNAITTRPLGIRRRAHTSRRKGCIITTLNTVISTILLLIIVSILEGIFHPSYANPPPHYKYLEEYVRKSSENGRANLRNEKVFIASNIIQADMIDGPWGQSLIELVDLLGSENVFVSIYENDSGNSSVRALRKLASKLQCQLFIRTTFMSRISNQACFRRALHHHWSSPSLVRLSFHDSSEWTASC